MTDTQLANELHAVLTQGPFNMGADGDKYLEPIRQLREAGHVILVGCKAQLTDGKTCHMVSFGQAESAMATREP